MKKLLIILSTFSLVSSSSLVSTTWVNQLGTNHQDLQNWAETNTVNTNEYGSRNAGIQKGFYIRFYITPAIYNMLSLAAYDANTLPDSAFHFYQFFLGETGKSPIYGTWGQVITQYNNIIEHYNEEYKTYGIDFGQIFRNWLNSNWSFFYKTLFGDDTSYNNWDYYPFPLDRPSTPTRLTAYWRLHGIILNIPFSLNNGTWKVDRTNFRIYPQLEGIEPILYYYNIILPDGKEEEPQINVPSPKKGASKVKAKALLAAGNYILKSFWSDLGVPPSLAIRTNYDYDENRYANQYIYRRGKGKSEPIAINFTVFDDRGDRRYVRVPITFWLTDN